MNHAEEIKTGKRFSFGENWTRFLTVLNEERIEVACESLEEKLGKGKLRGKSFLDIGSGSGLFSLAAQKLGASKVHSFDYDPHSVKCGKELKKRYCPEANWTLEEGSALNPDYLSKLGQFDIVYSWGVLHHTGNMWQALDNVIALVKPGGELFIALYNDQGWRSKIWKVVKRIYCSGKVGEIAMIALFFPYFFVGYLLADIVTFRNPFERYREYKKKRGMSMTHDWIDWLGGYPFEVAGFDEVVEFYLNKKFTLTNKTNVGNKLGCNEFIFINKI